MCVASRNAISVPASPLLAKLIKTRRDTPRLCRHVTTNERTTSAHAFTSGFMHWPPHRTAKSRDRNRMNRVLESSIVRTLHYTSGFIALKTFQRWKTNSSVPRGGFFALERSLKCDRSRLMRQLISSARKNGIRTLLCLFTILEQAFSN